MTRFLRISENAEVTAVESNGLEDLQRGVGGLITGVRAGSNLPVGTTVFANDEGIMLGMAPNLFASLLIGQPLYGPVLIGGLVDDEGYTLSVEARVERLIRNKALNFLS